MTELNKAEISLLERVAKGPVYFTHAPTARGTHTKLVKSSLSPKMQAKLEALAVLGHVARVFSGSAPHFPLETTVTYKITSRGRQALGIHAPSKLPVHRDVSLTDEQLEREGCR